LTEGKKVSFFLLLFLSIESCLSKRPKTTAISTTNTLALKEEKKYLPQKASNDKHLQLHHKFVLKCFVRGKTLLGLNHTTMQIYALVYQGFKINLGKISKMVISLSYFLPLLKEIL
jgi:hypothetical protein